MWDGSRNIRDLGGLPTAHSETGVTMFGRVARGPRREWLTTVGREDAVRWGLRTVVDLRNLNEWGPRPDDPGGATSAWDEVTIVHAPTEDPEHEEFVATCGPILDSPACWTHNARILPELLSRTLNAVAHAEPGVLVHCSGGRDRTGMITALLLANAGVAPDAVAADWALSVRTMHRHGLPAHDRQSRWDEPQVEEFVAEGTAVVESVAAHVATFLDDVGLDDVTRRRLRDLLVARPRRGGDTPPVRIRTGR